MSKNRSISVSISTSCLLIIAFAILAADFANGLGGGTGVGRRTKVADVKTNKEVQEVGRYSVEEHNRLQKKGHGSNGGGGDLKFSKVVAAETQVVSGIKYYLKVAAFEASSGIPKTFDAEVWVKPGGHSKKLLNFGPSPTTK